MSRPTPAAERLAASRLRLESTLGDVRRALDREVGWAPSTKHWMLPLLAFAGGLALAGMVAARRRRRAEEARADPAEAG